MTEMSRDEVLLLSNVLNEVCNGFGIPDFEQSIGVTRERASKLSTKIEVLATDTERHANHPGQNVLEFNSEDLSILKNALKANLEELGPDEFSIRTGCDFNEGRELLVDLARHV